MGEQRWLVTGARGMLGRDLTARLRDAGAPVTGLGHADLDICAAEAVGDAVAGHDVVVNCAAWTAVDDAEAHEEQAAAVNAEGARVLAAAARDAGARIVQVSTDYVFDGRATSPYAEHHALAPVSAYGRTKAAGEDAVRREHPQGHLVVRTAWLYGAHGPCFPKTIARAARERGALSVVADQHGQPTWTADVARVVVDLVLAGAAAGTYHATSSGQTTWFEFARAVVAAAGLDPGIVSPTTSDAYVRPAPRPAYSVLGHEAFAGTGVQPIDDWSARWAVAARSVLA
jgi:dTDP-4-dehydrorhamnose reductase